MHPAHMPDFRDHPLLVIWEVTRACALACRHCRASAEDRRDPLELTTPEGFSLINEVAEMGTPLIVFTGGDPLQRDDLESLIRHARERGLRVGVIPAATPRLSRARITSLARAGAEQIAFSLDGPDAESHDGLRGVPGTYDWVMKGVEWVKQSGARLQINTVFGAWNAHRYDEMAGLVTRLGADFWEVFFLVPTGRGAELDGCDAETTERLFAKLHETALRSPFTVKVTEASHYRRYVAQQAATPGARRVVGPAPVNSGRGFCFVDHRGRICPSGFLPLTRGDIRRDALADVYRHDPVFMELRNASLLKGRCGACEHRETCSGGSRARAYALTGDYLAAEPTCAI